MFRQEFKSARRYAMFAVTSAAALASAGAVAVSLFEIASRADAVAKPDQHKAAPNHFLAPPGFARVDPAGAPAARPWESRPELLGWETSDQ